jgi:N utilization substance protein B
VKPDRHHARILAMQLLCQLDVQGDDALAQVDQFVEAAQVHAATAGYAKHLARTCWEQRADLDRRISVQLEHWELARLSPVERNLIRVALGELAGGEVPPKVVINEAIEIGREYGGADSPRFINGILDALWKEDGSEE